MRLQRSLFRPLYPIFTPFRSFCFPFRYHRQPPGSRYNRVRLSTITLRAIRFSAIIGTPDSISPSPLAPRIERYSFAERRRWREGFLERRTHRRDFPLKFDERCFAIQWKNPIRDRVFSFLDVSFPDVSESWIGPSLSNSYVADARAKTLNRNFARIEPWTLAWGKSRRLEVNRDWCRRWIDAGLEFRFSDTMFGGLGWHFWYAEFLSREFYFLNV